MISPRNGRFTSSEIVALTARDKKGIDFGKPALTYIEEKNMERRLGKRLDKEANAKPLLWGNLLEGRVFDQLGLEYTLTSQTTYVHPKFDCWAGSPDGERLRSPEAVIDIKCPWTLKSFCQLVDAGIKGGIQEIRDKHDAGEKYYWQLVSNGVLRNRKHAELIVHMPYESEIDDIRFLAQGVPAEELSAHYFIAMGSVDDLPCLPNGGFYKNLYTFPFDIPAEDVELLTESVRMASAQLIPFPAPVKSDAI